VNTEDWEKVLVDATRAAQERVSSVARQGRRGEEVGVGASGDKTLLADRAAEDEILNSLKQVGGVRILSEEAGETGDRRARTLAVVDPLDGSSNFERAIPFYGRASGLVEGDSIEGATLGVVRNLVSGDVYVGVRGKGATKNGRQIRTNARARLAGAVIGMDVSRSPARSVELLAPLVSATKRQVHFGANALELCYLADGRIDAFVDLRGKMRVTDFAAAYLIAREAGALFTDAGGMPVRPELDLGHRFGFVGSASRGLHRQILRLVAASGRKG